MNAESLALLEYESLKSLVRRYVASDGGRRLLDEIQPSTDRAAAEAAIIDTLLTAYPDHAIWAEESGKREGKHSGADHVWIIDPLDGTTNFIHGFPVYCVSIALMVGNKLEQAVIYDPSRNDLFCATKGRGAYMNDRRIRVAKRIAMRDCLLSTGFPFRPGDSFQTYMQMLGEVMPKCAGVRRPGSAALDLAYVAAGFTDGFFEMGLSPWDVAAGALLVTEAGGLVGNFTGEANFLEQKECMAANPKIYGQLVGITSKYSKFASAGDKAALRQSLEKPVAEVNADPVVNAQTDNNKPADDFPPTVYTAPF